MIERIKSECGPEPQPEFIQKMQEIVKQKSIKVNDFAKRYSITAYQ